MGVIDQLDKHILSAVQIGADRGKIFGNIQDDRTVPERLLEVLQRAINDGPLQGRLHMQLNFSGFEPCHLRGFFHKAIQAITLFIDDGQKFVLLGISG